MLNGCVSYSVYDWSMNGIACIPMLMLAVQHWQLQLDLAIYL
jgi:hypothetical protein